MYVMFNNPEKGDRPHIINVANMPIGVRGVGVPGAESYWEYIFAGEYSLTDEADYRDGVIERLMEQVYCYLRDGARYIDINETINSLTSTKQYEAGEPAKAEYSDDYTAILENLIDAAQKHLRVYRAQEHGLSSWHDMCMRGAITLDRAVADYEADRQKPNGR